MNEGELKVGPSSAIWTQDNLWYGHITIWLNDEAGQIDIKQDFLYERDAMEWRRSFIDGLRGATVEVSNIAAKPTLANLYPYYSARQFNGRWYPVASVDGTNWTSPFEETFAPIHASQTVEKEDVLQWIRNNGGEIL